ncbi:hypothetical protein K456DRAFT_46145, partial [Colletotrichum gloeosporioides 23]
MPYTYCFQAKVPCRFSEKSSKCYICIKAKKPYNSVLDEKEEKASEELLTLHQEFTRLQTQIAEAASRLSYIHKMRKLVREHQTEAFERGIQEINKEDSILPA